MTPIEDLARRRGFELRRGRRDPTKVWLIRDGQLFTRAAGTDEKTVRDLLGPVNSRRRTAV